MMLGFDAGGGDRILPDGPACSLVSLPLQAVSGGVLADALSGGGQARAR